MSSEEDTIRFLLRMPFDEMQLHITLSSNIKIKEFVESNGWTFEEYCIERYNRHTALFNDTGIKSKEEYVRLMNIYG